MKSHRILLPLAALFVVMAGCSGDRTAPMEPVVVQALGGPGLDARSALIGPDGGTVASGNVRVDVPAGALAEPVMISITRLADGSVDLTPNGQTFLLPVTLTFVLAPGKDAEHHAIEWLDAARGWVAIPSEATHGMRAAMLEHFSIYHIIEYE